MSRTSRGLLRHRREDPSSSASRNAIGSTRRRRNDGSGGHGGVAHPRRMLEKHLGQPAELVPPSAVECSQMRRRQSAPVAPAAQGHPAPQNPACAVATTSATNPGSPVPLTPEQKAEALAVTFGRVLAPPNTSGDACADNSISGSGSSTTNAGGAEATDNLFDRLGQREKDLLGKQPQPEAQSPPGSPAHSKEVEPMRQNGK